ncbi:MAG: hypothetical protein ABUL73_03970 [Alphaproteobacteria bacterium]
MDQATMLHYVVLALGGLVGANVLGALTRGGGGVIGRSIFGVIGGLAGGFAVDNVAQIGAVSQLWGNLLPSNPDYSTRLAELITGAVGGGVFGFVTGMLIRPRS